jgi:hypothetical protein
LTIKFLSGNLIGNQWREMGMRLYVQKRPPIDIGAGIYANGRHWRLALAVVDIEMNLTGKSGKFIAIGAGVPFWRALILFVPIGAQATTTV